MPDLSPTSSNMTLYLPFAAAKYKLELKESTILQRAARDSSSSTSAALVANTTTLLTDVSPPSYSMSNGQNHNNSRGR